MNRILVILSIVLPLTVACQKSEDTTLQNGTKTTGAIERPKLVRNARGIYLAHSCMTANGKALDALAASKGIDAASKQLEAWCDVKNMAAEERQRACAPTCYVGQIPWSNYYYPPSYYNNQQTNVNLTFNNYFFGGNYQNNGYQMLGYNPQQQYNPYPQNYQPYPYQQPYQQQQPYNYQNYNYGGQYQQGQPFYYNTNYYNQAPSNQFCNTACQGGNGVGCANTCWYGGQSQNFGYNGQNGQNGATVIP